MMIRCYITFFFSSRRRHTRCLSDWSSDVCSSDLPKALVLALTPLLDDRAISALLDLRARGFDLVVIEVSPLPFVEPDRDELGRLSYRLWRLSRESLRAGYEQAGVPVVEWQVGTPLDVPIEEVRTFRRFARPARA